MAAAILCLTSSKVSPSTLWTFLNQNRFRRRWKEYVSFYSLSHTHTHTRTTVCKLICFTNVILRFCLCGRVLRVPFQNPIRHIIVKNKVTNPRDWMLEFAYRFEIWNHTAIRKLQTLISHLQDLKIRRLIGYCNDPFYSSGYMSREWPSSGRPDLC